MDLRRDFTDFRKGNALMKFVIFGSLPPYFFFVWNHNLMKTIIYRSPRRIDVALMDFRRGFVSVASSPVAWRRVDVSPYLLVLASLTSLIVMTT